MKPVYEDNHIIVIDKKPGEIVQGDKTGDKPLVDMVKDYIKEKYNKPGNVFCGVVHRIDRPTSGLVIFAKTSKALSRLNEMLRKGEIHKTYRAILTGHLKTTSGKLKDHLVSNPRNNKTYVNDSSNPCAKEAILEYNVIENGENYTLAEIRLLTGRKHQIRAQFSNIGHPIKGDLKYGARRSNPDGSISLQAAKLEFIHPVSKIPLTLEVPTPLSLPS